MPINFRIDYHHLQSEPDKPAKAVSSSDTCNADKNLRVKAERSVTKCNAASPEAGLALSLANFAATISRRAGDGVFPILESAYKRKPQERPKTPDPKLLGAIRSRAENFERNALAYYLWREANRRHLDRRRAQEIFATYGEVVACPVMDLSDLYGIGKVSSREVRGAAATWLQGEGLAINPEDSVSESLGIPLKKRASLRAAAIIDAGETSEDNDRVARGRNEGTNAEGFGADRTALGGRPHLIH